MKYCELKEPAEVKDDPMVDGRWLNSLKVRNAERYAAATRSWLRRSLRVR
jgi:hypothetical protein